MAHQIDIIIKGPISNGRRGAMAREKRLIETKGLVLSFSKANKSNLEVEHDECSSHYTIGEILSLLAISKY